jgi:hypothetical protein
MRTQRSHESRQRAEADDFAETALGFEHAGYESSQAGPSGT